VTGTTRPTVYVVQETDHALAKAQVYGDLRFLLPRGRGGLRDTSTVGQLRRAMGDIEPDDWVLPVGDPAAIAVAAVEFARQTGRIRLLRWDRQKDDYEPLEFML